MIFFAHHVAVEILGREFSPHTTFEHICTFGALGTVFALAAYGAWTLATKLRGATGRGRDGSAQL